MLDNKTSKDLQVREWIKKAEDDELNAYSILKHRDGTPNGVCFLSHQMAEKLLKAFLIGEVKGYPKIHALDKLVELCNENNGLFIKVKDDAIFLNSFYTPSRYPSDFPDFTWSDAQKALKSAKKIKKLVLDNV